MPAKGFGAQMLHVGKYSSPMKHLGKNSPFIPTEIHV